jgi:hypothetical protein
VNQPNEAASPHSFSQSFTIARDSSSRIVSIKEGSMTQQTQMAEHNPAIEIESKQNL